MVLEKNLPHGENIIFKNSTYLSCSAILLLSAWLLFPQSSSAACSYDDADLYGGWGWDSNTMESCAPITEEIVVVSSTCEDRGGFPWGWDPVKLESCRLDEEETEPPAPIEDDCFDSPPIGDGWGWNGVSSCRIEDEETEPPTPIENDCFDSAPIGDGWGWNGVNSCRIDDEDIELELYRCDDTGYYPWGWNPSTSSSCRLDLLASPDYANSSEVPIWQMIDLSLTCKRVTDDFNSIDQLSSASNLDDVFFTATLERLSTTVEVFGVIYETLEIIGTWQESMSNQNPVYRPQSFERLYYAPSLNTGFEGTLTYLRNSNGDLFMHESNSFDDGSEHTVVSFCVEQ